MERLLQPRIGGIRLSCCRRAVPRIGYVISGPQQIPWTDSVGFFDGHFTEKAANRRLARGTLPLVRSPSWHAPAQEQLRLQPAFGLRPESSGMDRCQRDNAPVQVQRLQPQRPALASARRHAIVFSHLQSPEYAYALREICE